MLWLGRSAVGRWGSVANTLCIFENTNTVGLDLYVVEVGNAYYILSFSSSVFRDCALENIGDWFSKFFLDVKLWDSSDLAHANVRWSCLKGIPLPY